ncbi:MAG: succinate dehydrogenase assembly factor 2 [Rhodobacterales bacterium]|nr:MAG: succinate dehydrogenase assembly factor 2 [Rhodobacterales bacterium]
MTEATKTRLKRLKMRSWRRGTKEMDLVLGPFSDTELAKLEPEQIALYDQMLNENDHDLYGWVAGHIPTPAPYLDLITRINKHAFGR